MKNKIEKTSLEAIREYFEDTDSISQSRLKLLLSDNPKKFIEENDKNAELYFSEKEYFIIGSALDLKLTGTQEDFDETYLILEEEFSISDTVKSIIKQTYDTLLRNDILDFTDLFDSQELLLQSAKDHNYQKRWKDETIIKNLIEKGERYFNFLKIAEGKDILTLEQYHLVRQLEKKIEEDFNFLFQEDITSPILKKYSRIKVRHQLPIYFKIGSYKAKALLDIVVEFYDENGKLILVKPYDIKSMSGSLLTFPKAFRRRRYDIQAKWYVEALKTIYKNVIIDEFSFIVVSTTNLEEPAKEFVVDDVVLYNAMEGLEKVEQFGIILRNEVKGIKNLLSLYDFYMRNGFSYHKKLHENKILKMDWNGIQE